MARCYGTSLLALRASVRGCRYVPSQGRRDVVAGAGRLGRAPSVQVAEMARVCRRSGRIVLIDMITDSAERSVRDHLERLRDLSHTRTPTFDDLRTLVTTAGASSAPRFDAVVGEHVELATRIEKGACQDLAR